MRKNYIFLLALAGGIVACEPQLDYNPDLQDEGTSFEDLRVDSNFNFETASGVQLYFTEENPTISASYTIYILDEARQMIEIGGGTAVNGVLDINMTLPTSTTEIYVERNQMGIVRGQTLDVLNRRVEHVFEADEIPNNVRIRTNSNARAATAGCSEVLYGVNGNGEFFTIASGDDTYDSSMLPDLVGGGSIACAVDRANRLVYYNTNTTLRTYDIDAGTFQEIHQGNPFGKQYPRMEFNNTNGLLYIAHNQKMHLINPINNEVVSSYDIVGLQDPVSGGDVAISLDGTIYMCCFSGLYRIDELNDSEGKAYTTRISAENLPFQPTSMAIDRNDRLYMGTNDSNSQLIEMDKADGAWTVRKTYNHKINDLGSLPCTEDELDQTDSDGDGVLDVNDDYPNDPDRATDIYGPSKLGWGSYGFEDLWPKKGDYDFNDLVVNYRYTLVANAQNQVKELWGKFRVKSLVGDLHNGFGVEIPVDASLVESVTGSRRTRSLTTLNDKGMEDGQGSRTVVIVFEDAYSHATQDNCNQEGEEIDIRIIFTEPIDGTPLTIANMNPFMFINADRSKEVHLADKLPTALADNSFFGTDDDDSDENASRYYKTANNHPWAIDIIHSFKPPRENRDITNSYHRFKNWAESSGIDTPDWYKDNQGYRNEENLCD
ncbi:LruC domain-containing protein [Sediminitomix flava]|uniref:LruC domain-containing protein n=1 Tax=Sediminitomix flava TaxID=379075 RepID=A0A315ZYY7_SEDFL|nr:LruC domain-containing protein [Sediminitomix flava]PWJ42587.1 LruC domain-containing protein [Sediminitomix flava]